MNKLVFIDHQIFVFMNSFAGQNYILERIFSITAFYFVYSVPVILLFCWFYSDDLKKASFKAFCAGMLAWFGVSNLVGSLYFRPRPFIADEQIKELLFHRPDRSFPSDHAALLFAIAFTFWFLGYRKLGLGFFAISVAVVIMRIVVGIHYPADVAAGTLIGLAMAVLVLILNKQLDHLVAPIIRIAKKVKLG